MKNVTITSVLAVLVIAPLASTQAQRQPLPVEPSARVRITTTALRHLEGRRIESTRLTVAQGLLREIRPEGFAIVADLRPRLAPRDRVITDALPVLIGGGVGAVLGAVIGARVGARDSTVTRSVCVGDIDIIFGCQQYSTGRSTIRVTNDRTVYIGAVVGGVVGLLVGVIVAADRAHEARGEVAVGALLFDLGGIGRGEISARLPLPR
jgi:hypothetical protein